MHPMIRSITLGLALGLLACANDPSDEPQRSADSALCVGGVHVPFTARCNDDSPPEATPSRPRDDQGGEWSESCQACGDSWQECYGAAHTQADVHRCDAERDACAAGAGYSRIMIITRPVPAVLCWE